MKTETLKKLAGAAAAVAPVVAVPLAIAGTGGTEFGAIATTLTDWLEGGLGQVLAIAALGVGLAIGVVQQSIMSVVVGVAMAIAVFYGPGLLTGIVASGLPY